MIQPAERGKGGTGAPGQRQGQEGLEVRFHAGGETGGENEGVCVHETVRRGA